VVRDHENNGMKRIYQGGCSASATARVHAFLLEAPIEITADCLQSDRGCKFDCYFCANASSSGVVPPRKPLDEIIALVTKVRCRRKAVFFLDNNIFADPGYAKALFQALKPLKMFWAANASIDIAHDDETVRLLKDSGCVGLLIGYEIDDGSAEEKTGGKLALARDYLRLTRKLQRAGIQVKAHFMFGFPGDDWRSLLRSWWFCLRLLPAFTVISFLTPIPGARFFGEAVQDGRIIDLNWRKYDIFHQVWRHPRLGCPWLLREAFNGIMLVFLFTASSLGRLFLLVLVLLELIYYYVVA
jgi:radical SAM superfamily enzyme YgiQ (UPF0313 family)